MLRDPFGHRWSIASRIEDLSPRTMKSRATAWPDTLVVKQLSLELVSSLILGLVVAALARPAATSKSAPLIA
jgi:hypothetical protein